MPSNKKKIRRAKLGPRFSDPNNQVPRFFRDAEDFVGPPQHYLPGTFGGQATQAFPPPPEVDAYYPRPAAQTPVPTHQPTQHSWNLPPEATFSPPLVELPPTPAPQLGQSFGFPAFHLTIPPCPPRTTSPPLEHPSMLLNSNTVPIQVTPHTGERKPRHGFQPAPHRPINLTSVSSYLLQPPSVSTTPNELPMAPATVWSDNMLVDQSDGNPFALPASIEYCQALRHLVFGINQSYEDDNPFLLTSSADTEAIIQHLNGHSDLALVFPNFNEEPTFNDYMKQWFSCTADQGWVGDIIIPDYRLMDIYNSGSLQREPPVQWRSKVNVWLHDLSGVALWQKLRYAIAEDILLYDGTRCTLSFIWIVFLIRRVLLSLPYAQHLGVLERLGKKELDPCDTTFTFLTLSRVIFEVMDAIILNGRAVKLSKVPLGQRKVLSTCSHGHVRVTTILGSQTLSQFNDDTPLSVPGGIDFINRFRFYFIETLEEIDDDCLTSLVVARCIHPLEFFV